jgi:hypothetical protein
MGQNGGVLSARVVACKYASSTRRGKATHADSVRSQRAAVVTAFPGPDPPFWMSESTFRARCHRDCPESGVEASAALLAVSGAPYQARDHSIDL